ncbi:MAG: hypothetical protein FWF53_03290 [Candidatus Azobacteroides sp.]|nr:hypothetical protein [Candidatus Azobacteroides sp.]
MELGSVLRLNAEETGRYAGDFDDSARLATSFAEQLSPAFLCHLTIGKKTKCY